MINSYRKIVNFYNAEAELSGLPSIRADLPLSDQRTEILEAIGKRCLEYEGLRNIHLMRRIWSAFLLAEQKQLAFEADLGPAQEILGERK